MLEHPQRYLFHPFELAKDLFDQAVVARAKNRLERRTQDPTKPEILLHVLSVSAQNFLSRSGEALQRLLISARSSRL